MKLRFELNETAIGGTASQRSALPSQWVTLPTQVRTIAALESHLRGQSWGGWIVEERLAFLVEGAQVLDSTESCVGAKAVEVTLASHLYARADGEQVELVVKAEKQASEQAGASEPANSLQVVQQIKDEEKQEHGTEVQGSNGIRGSDGNTRGVSWADKAAADAWVPPEGLQVNRQPNHPETAKQVSQLSEEAKAKIVQRGLPGYLT